MALPKLNTPTYQLSLPSSGKTVKYRPFLVKEHKILLTMSEADDSEVSRIVKELVDVCTFNELDVSKLPHFDIEYIFLHLRAKSIGENVEVIVNCECGEKIEASFNIEDVKIEKQADNSNKIMLDDEHGIEMNYPKFENVVKIYSTKETEAVVNLITSCVKGIFDSENYWEAEDQTKEELEEFVLSLTKQQFDKIEDFFVRSPKVVQTIECDCKSCGKHNVTRLEGLSNFFV